MLLGRTSVVLLLARAIRGVAQLEAEQPFKRRIMNQRVVNKATFLEKLHIRVVNLPTKILFLGWVLAFILPRLGRLQGCAKPQVDSSLSSATYVDEASKAKLGKLPDSLAAVQPHWYRVAVVLDFIWKPNWSDPGAWIPSSNIAEWMGTQRSQCWWVAILNLPFSDVLGSSICKISYTFKPNWST